MKIKFGLITEWHLKKGMKAHHILVGLPFDAFMYHGLTMVLFMYNMNYRPACWPAAMATATASRPHQ